MGPAEVVSGLDGFEGYQSYCAWVGPQRRAAAAPNRCSVACACLEAEEHVRLCSDAEVATDGVGSRVYLS